jgi:hypothetical protein
LGIVIFAPQYNFLSGEIIFSFKAADAIIGLIIDPVAYCPAIDRLKRGLFLSKRRRRDCCRVTRDIT